MKLWKAGVRYFKGIGRSRVYHFQTKSTSKVVKNDGATQFRKKWGHHPGYIWQVLPAARQALGRTGRRGRPQMAHFPSQGRRTLQKVIVWTESNPIHCKPQSSQRTQRVQLTLRSLRTFAVILARKHNRPHSPAAFQSVLRIS